MFGKQAGDGVCHIIGGAGSFTPVPVSLSPGQAMELREVLDDARRAAESVGNDQSEWLQENGPNKVPEN